MFTTFKYHYRIISCNHFKKFIALNFVTSPMGIGHLARYLKQFERLWKEIEGHSYLALGSF